MKLADHYAAERKANPGVEIVPPRFHDMTKPLQVKIRKESTDEAIKLACNFLNIDESVYRASKPETDRLDITKDVKYFRKVILNDLKLD